VVEKIPKPRLSGITYGSPGTSGGSAAAGGICARNSGCPKYLKASCGYFG